MDRTGAKSEARRGRWRGSEDRNLDVSAGFSKWVLLGVILGGIAFLLLRPSPFAREVAWIPGPLAAWADGNPNLRTFVVALVANGVALVLFWGQQRGHRFAVLGVTAALMAFEIAQIVIPGRSFSLADLGWTALAGALVSLAVTRLKR